MYGAITLYEGAETSTTRETQLTQVTFRSPARGSRRRRKAGRGESLNGPCEFKALCMLHAEVHAVGAAHKPAAVAEVHAVEGGEDAHVSH